MKAVRSFLPLVLMAGALVAQSIPAQPVLSVVVGPAVEFTLTHANSPFGAAVVLSFAPDQTHWFQGLPPILSDFVVLGVAYVDNRFVIAVPHAQLPSGVLLYGQGIVYDGNLLSTPVAEFVVEFNQPK